MKFIALITTILLCWPPVQASASPRQELLLFYSNDVTGETAPCG